MANFINYIIESSIQPVKTNVLWIKNGVPYYFNKKWKPLLGSGSGGGPGESVDSPIQFGEGEYSAVLKNSNSRTLNDYALALGYNTVSNNPSETAFGKFNKSVSSSDFSKATLFSIGNGTVNFLKNAFEVKFDGSIYIEGVDITLQKYLENLTNEDLQFYSEITRIDDELKVIKDSIDIAVGEGFSEFIEQFENSIKRIEVLEDKTVENSTKITQTAENITSEVSRIETKYDNELKTVKESTSSIDQKADSINLRVEGLEGTLNSKTSELEGKITKNTSEIALNKEQIGLKVNTDVFDELAGTVEQQGASIEINTNSIKNKVEQSSFNAFTGEVSNQFTEVNQSIEGITTTVQDNTGKITVIEETVDGLTSKTGTLEAEIESLKKQSDGSIDTHFGTTAPTLDNEPAVNWDTDELKNEHTGDIYYNNNTGEAYRFSYDPQTNTYFWVELTDSALTDALEKISKLEEAIDGKVTIFYTQPSNYKYGDIWFVHNSSYSPYKEGSLLTATNLAKDTIVESFNLNHWVLKADIVKSLNDLDKTVTDAFKDNIITIAEVDAIKESKKSFEASFQELTSAHAIVIATTLGNSTKLKTAYSNLESKYNVFIQSIDSLILDSNGNLSDVLLQAYTTAYNDYVEALKNYSKAKEELTDSIQRELSSANDYIKDISSDGVITPIEKKNLIEIWRSIAEEFNSNKGIAVNYKIIDSEGNERTDIYSDGVYYSNYALYEAAFDEIKTIFTSDVFGISNTTTSTTLPEGYSTNTIDDALNNYYDTLSVFAEMISKITIEITDAHEKVLQLSKELQEQLSPSDNITQIGKGVILSSIIGVQSNGVLQAGLNATNINGLVDTSKDNHGRIVFAGGINGAPDWNTANTVIYEDGYVHFKWGEIDEGVEIGNALIRSVVSGSIDLFSYPENGTLVPLFIVNKDNTGKIVSISTPYDFIANKNLIVHGDTSSGGEGGSSSVGIQGIKLNGTTYRDENSDGIIDLGTIGGGTLTEITYEMIVEALGYTPVSSASLGSLAYANGVTWAQVSGLLAGGDEFNIVPSGHNGVFSFNHRAKDGGSATITEYRMRNGGGSYAPVRASSFIAHGGTSSQFLKADGSLDGTSYLSTAGGTIEGTTNGPLVVNTTNASEVGIPLAINSSKKVWFGYSTAVGGAYMYNAVAKRYMGILDDGSAFLGGNTILHSGNIGDYKAGDSDKLGGYSSSDYVKSLLDNTDDCLNFRDRAILKTSWISGQGDFGTLIIPTWVGNKTNDYYLSELRFENFQPPKFRCSHNGVVETGWKTVAFTSDLENYLPLSGGIIDGNITLRAASSSSDSWLNFTDKGTSEEYAIGIRRPTSTYGLQFKSKGSYYTIYHSGNFNPANYLPLTGGTITGNLIIQAGSGDVVTNSLYPTVDNAYTLGNGSRNWNNIFTYLINGYTPIHAGNVGDYHAGSANILDSSYQENINYAAYTTHLKLIKSVSGDYATNGFPIQYVSGLSVMSGYTGWQMVTYGDPASDMRPYFRAVGGGGDWQAWKQLAFTDSNVASATKLQTARTIWGQSFDGTGNVGGNLYLYKSTIVGGTAAFPRTMIDLTYENAIFLGYGCRNDGTIAYYAQNHKFKVGDSDVMLINSSGNVTIGASDLAGTSAKLYVDGDIHLGIARLCSIGAPYSASDPMLYNRIAIDNAFDGIKYYSGGWTGSIDYISHEFIVGSNNKSALAITNGGNVLIGTTSDEGYKLDVNGTGRFTGELNVEGKASIGAVIHLTRDANVNYIWANKAGSTIALGVQDAGSNGTSYASLLITASTLFPGYRSGVVSLGSASYRWLTIYGVNGNLSGTLNVGGNTTINGNLVVAGDISA